MRPSIRRLRGLSLILALNLVACGNTSGRTTQPTPTPTIPPPSLHFTLSPTSFIQHCAAGVPLGVVSVILDNAGGATPVSWMVRISDRAPDARELWATVFPSADTTAAGATMTLWIFPAGDLCEQQLTAGLTSATYHLQVVLTAGSEGTYEIGDTIVNDLA